MACPLTLLRQYNVNRKEIVERDEHVIFGEFSWPTSAKTNYVMYGSNKDGAEKSYYTLGCVLYFLKNSRLAHGAYVRQAMTDKVPMVRRPDRKDMLAYLSGATATCPAIDKYAILEPPATRQHKRVADNNYCLLQEGSVAAKKPRLVDVQQAVQESATKQRLAAKLDNKPDDEVAVVVVDNIKSLSDAMSVEKIAAIKAKRMAKKRTTIKGYDDLDIMDVDGSAEHATDSAMTRVEESEDTARILARERVLRSRENILQSGGKDFQRSVFSILRSVEAKEKNAGKEVPAVPNKLASPKPRGNAQPVGYNRYDQQRFVQQKAAAEGFVIDTTSTYHGWSLKSVTEGGGGAKPSNVAKPTALPAVVAAPQQQQKKRASRTPIIVVPNSDNSLVTTCNARHVLQDLSFKSNKEVKALNGKRENEVLLQRRKDGNLTVPYLVVDNPLKLKKEDWDRVVAVLVLGPQWQFKGWPFAGNPVEIFSRIPAFHFKYDEMPLDPNVAKWAVKIIEINKTRRHLDRAAIIKFWEELDKHMVTSKPHLRF